MQENRVIRKIPLRYDADRLQLEQFLNGHGLRLEDDIDTAFGIFDGEERLLGCGCAAGRLLKCFAVDEELRGQNALGSLISSLTQERFSSGYYDLFVITRTHNLPLFTACGYYEVAHSDTVAMLENRSGGVDTFTKPLWQEGDDKRVIGSIVMNCNPFTNGHRFLIETAAARCDALHVFVVEEDRSLFPTAARFRLVQEGTADLPNVRVHLSGPYMISGATFPTYFLKKEENAVDVQVRLDVMIFAQRIAPALHITKRFAGSEPFDPVTARYNDAMRRLLPQYGIEFCQVPRFGQNGLAVSASRVRGLLEEKGVCAEVLAMVPESTRRYLLTEYQHGI